jgi:hypothetical protein
MDEDLASIRSRQNIQKLVLAGKMGEALHLTEKLYPDLLENNPSLQFMLKVRQFIEMVSGCDSLEAATRLLQQDNMAAAMMHTEDSNSNSSNGALTAGGSSSSNSADAGMITNGNTDVKTATNGNSIQEPPSTDDTMDVDPSPTNDSSGESARYSLISNPARFDKLIRFGQSLQMLLSEMETVRGIKNDRNSKTLQDAFSLLAYTDPWSSPVGWQLNVKEREAVSAALNSAILEAKQLPGRPPLEVAISHTKQLLKTMGTNDLGASAFANVDEFFR